MGTLIVDLRNILDIRDLCRRTICRTKRAAMATMTVQQAYEMAVRLQQAGRMREALSLYQQIVAHQPDFARGWYMLAVMEQQAGRSEEALALIAKAISLDPPSAAFHML